MTCFLYCRYETVVKAKGALFNSLQDSEDKLYGFLDWLLDAIAVHNSNSHLQPITAPSQQLEHAVQALSCVKKCPMGIAGLMAGIPKATCSRDLSYGPSICRLTLRHPQEA